MPIHDWTRADANLFHAFHLLWIVSLVRALNTGLLPHDYLARPEEFGERLPTENGGSGGKPFFPKQNVVIRRGPEREVVARIELVSPTVKASAMNVRVFTGKIIASIEQGIHVLLIDILPMTAHDPRGIHGVVWGIYHPRRPIVEVDGPLVIVSFLGRPGNPEAFIHSTAVGQALPDVPLFLTAQQPINIPLEATYQDAFNAMSPDDREYVEEGGDVED